MRRSLLVTGSWVVAMFAIVACGDDTGSGGAGAGSTGGGGSGEGAGTAGGPQSGGGGAGDGGSSGSLSVGGGGASNCDGLPPGPITPIEVTDLFSGSEDFAFDGNGGIVGKDGGQIVRIDANDGVTNIAAFPQDAYGLRYGVSGDLFVAKPGQGILSKVTGSTVTDFVTGLGGPNGVYPDFDGNVWVTEFGADQVIKVDAQGEETTIATGAAVNAPNGVVLDAARDLLWFTNYFDGELLHVDPAGGEPVLVGSVANAALDGVVLDSCGNLYAVDQGNSRVYRFNLDAAGALIGAPELIADFPANVANAQFGSGAGWNATSLYAAGNPGVVYEVPLGVTGAPVPTAP